MEETVSIMQSQSKKIIKFASQKYKKNKVNF